MLSKKCDIYHKRLIPKMCLKFLEKYSSHTFIPKLLLFCETFLPYLHFPSFIASSAIRNEETLLFT